VQFGPQVWWGREPRDNGKEHLMPLIRYVYILKPKFT
jgi:hypothetical protein